MRYLVATLFLTSLSFLSCKTYQIEKMSSLGESLTEEEMVALSQDCEYVKKNIKRGLKRLDGSIEDKKLKKAERKARERRNDFLVSLLKVTPCFKGQTKEEIIKLFGNPFRNCEGCLKDRVEYNFHIGDNEFDSITFRFEENRVVRTQVFRGIRFESHPNKC